MSIRLMTQVWECEFDQAEQAVMLVMADVADDDGSNCYPSIARVAWKVGFTRRTVQRIVARLRERGVLVSQGPTRSVPDRRYAPTEYRIDLTKVAKKEPYEAWSSRTRDDEPDPVEGRSRGDRGVIEGRSRGDGGSPLPENEGRSRGDSVTPLPDGSNLRGDSVTPLRGDRGVIAVTPDPSVVVVATDPDPEKAAAAGVRGAGEGVDDREPWHDLEGERLDVFWEIVRAVGERMALAPGSADAVLDWVQLCEELGPGAIREGIRECRRRNVKPWPRNLRECSPGGVRASCPDGGMLGSSYEERVARYGGGALPALRGGLDIPGVRRGA